MPGHSQPNSKKEGGIKFDTQHRPTQEDVGKEPTISWNRKDRAKQFRETTFECIVETAFQ